MSVHIIIIVIQFNLLKAKPKMQSRFSGRLRESNHRGSLPRKGPDTSTLEKKFIACMQWLSCDPCEFPDVVTPWLHRTYSEHRDQTMRQVIAYKRVENNLKLN